MWDRLFPSSAVQAAAGEDPVIIEDDEIIIDHRYGEIYGGTCPASLLLMMVSIIMIRA